MISLFLGLCIVFLMLLIIASEASAIGMGVVP